MDRVNNQLVLITGATSGFGEACARRFAAGGSRLILWARRFERLERLKHELASQHGVDARIDGIDVRDRDAVLALGDELAAAGLEPDILLNNAGLASGLDTLQDGDFDDWDRMIDTNVKGLLNVTRAILPMMVARDSGHVINIGSIAGRIVYPKGNVYNASKFAVRALSQAMNIDLIDTNIRCCTVDPGAAETEFSEVRFHGDTEQAKKVYEGFQPLSADDVADAVLYVVNTPDHVNVTDVVIMPTAQRSPYLLRRTSE